MKDLASLAVALLLLAVMAAVIAVGWSWGSRHAPS